MVYCVRLSTAKLDDSRGAASPLGNAEGTALNRAYCTSFDGSEVMNAKAPSASWGAKEVIDSAAGVSGSELAATAPGHLCRQNMTQLGLYHSISAIVAASGLVGLATEDLRRGLGVDTKVSSMGLQALHLAPFACLLAAADTCPPRCDNAISRSPTFA